MGGLLIWIDEANYLRLDWGTGGPREITLSGCLEDQDAIYGRGRLPPRSGEGADRPLARVWLRLEWTAPERAGLGGRVRALCSADEHPDRETAGQAWYTAGSVALPSPPWVRPSSVGVRGGTPFLWRRGGVQAGVYACGAIDRTLYLGAYPEGTAIRFESFRCWELSP